MSEAKPAAVVRVAAEPLRNFCEAAFLASGADEATAKAATKAMMHGSSVGIDSHGVRMLGHYTKAIRNGRVNGRPELKFIRQVGATAVLDADDGHGALATYRAMEKAVDLAGHYGTGSVAIRNSSHLGAAGAYPLVATDAGQIGYCFCNADAIVRLHGGAQKFHGTNPIAVGVPIPGERPWLLDVPTSSMPLQKVNLLGSLGKAVPPGVASDEHGQDTDDPKKVKMLAPLGGADFGYKGAALAGLVEIMSTALTGAGLSFELLGMAGDDLSRPRHLGAFVMALNPEAFIEREAFEATMRRYIDALRNSPAVPGGRVMAPGDREWEEAERRASEGIPLDPRTQQDFAEIAARHGLAAPEAIG